MDAWERRMTRQADPEPRLELLEWCWTFRGPNSGRAISCGIYKTDTGLEVRAGYSVDDVLRTQHAPGIESARVLADGWRAALIDKGFLELPERTA